MSKIHISGILARDLNKGIGKNGKMPWHIPEDFKHFKRYTQDKVCVMGRKTFEDIISYKKEMKGPVLLNRHCVVLTSDPDKYDKLGLENVQFEKVGSLNALRQATAEGLLGPKVCVVGGASVFEAFAGAYNELSITSVWKEFDCDTFIDILKITEGMDTCVQAFEIDTGKDYGADVMVLAP